MTELTEIDIGSYHRNALEAIAICDKYNIRVNLITKTYLEFSPLWYFCLQFYKPEDATFFTMVYR